MGKGNGDSGDGAVAGAAKILTKAVESPGALREKKPKDRGGKGGGKKSNQPKPDPNFQPKAANNMKATGDDAVDRARLREQLHNKIDDVSDLSNPDRWGKSKREPCVSAVWDRKTGDIFYNHNDRDTPVDKDKMDPLLRERFEKYEKHEKSTNDDEREASGWKRLEDNQEMHGVPGQHSETRATDEALKKAREDPNRDPKLSDFMVENAQPKNKRPMPCCANCTQMIDGVNGSSAGWVHQDGKKTKLVPWDGSV
jgi:hypothetical protein